MTRKIDVLEIKRQNKKISIYIRVRRPLGIVEQAYEAEKESRKMARLWKEAVEINLTASTATCLPSFGKAVPPKEKRPGLTNKHRVEGTFG